MEGAAGLLSFIIGMVLIILSIWFFVEGYKSEGSISISIENVKAKGTFPVILFGAGVFFIILALV